MLSTLNELYEGQVVLEKCYALHFPKALEESFLEVFCSVIHASGYGCENSIGKMGTVCSWQQMEGVVLRNQKCSGPVSHHPQSLQRSVFIKSQHAGSLVLKCVLHNPEWNEKQIQGESHLQWQDESLHTL